MKMVFLCIFIFFAHIICANDIDLLNEYKFLCVDLENIGTWGYKSYYNNELNKADGYINISQGAIQITDVYSDYAIAGDGFFKIRLKDDIVAYTRSGNFLIDSEGNIVTSQGYYLYNNICLGENFLPETLRITKDHNIYINVVKDNKITEIKTGQLLTYKIPNEYLDHYEKAIYRIKENVEYIEEITSDTHIISGALEMSNNELLSIVIRMYYILNILDEDSIKNIEFKKKLLHTLLKYILNYNIINTMDNFNNYAYCIEAITKFIKYDY